MANGTMADPGMDGSVVVITGSTRGLGFATARAFVAAGARVVVTSRTQTSVRAAVAALPEGSAAGVVADMAEEGAAERLCGLALERFGRLDAWINNAALSGPYGPTAALALPDLQAVVDVNIGGTARGSVVALRHFQAHGRGTLVNLLGRGDRGPVPFQNAYASSKAWVRAFTGALAKEVAGSGVRVYGFNPGLMRTELVGTVRAVRGYEARLAPLRTVLRMWSTPVEVPARRLVRLVAGTPAVPSGRMVTMLGPGRLLTGALGEGVRRIRGAPTDDVPLEVETVEPAGAPARDDRSEP